MQTLVESNIYSGNSKSGGTCLSFFQGHLGPVVSMAYDCTSTLLASGMVYGRG